MTVHVDRTVTDVVPTPETTPDPETSGTSRWEEMDRLRRTLERARRLAERTRAEDFHD